jgi:hypothetical protein
VQPEVATKMIAASVSRPPARRRPPPWGRFTSVGDTTRRNSIHNSSGTNRITRSAMHHSTTGPLHKKLPVNVLQKAVSRAFLVNGCGLRAEPVWVETFTGLRMRQFERLLRVVRERGGNGPGGGRTSRPVTSPWASSTTRSPVT